MTISKDLLDKAEKHLVELGLERFIVLVPPDDDGKMSATIHQVKAKEVVNMYINFLLQAIDHELAGNSYKKAYAKIFTDFKLKFKELVGDVNRKIEKFDASEAKKTEEVL